MAEALAGSETIRRALAVLNLEHREVIVLRYFADLTIPDVARSLNLRQGTVKSRLHRALEQLRSQLSEHDVREVQDHGT
ncbi:MAG: sigma-70 family RNA polymerase sigma factor [Dehalococcoidia bacterium]|nr:sigma-70 family RNA polymerase sigma factor [Dehalococcoidia bacterium]